jgi:single stranded DNA-binding protein
MSETSYNRVELSGMVQNVVMRQTLKGDAVCNFLLQVIDSFKGDKARRQFVTCCAWRGLAKRITEMPKGQRVRLIGRLETVSWEDKKSGARQYKLRIVADEAEPIAHLQAKPSQADIDKRPTFHFR